MELSILDRVLLLNILPATGDILTLRIVRRLREDLSFTEAELEEFELTQHDGFVQWNVEKAHPKVVEFGKNARRLVVDALKEKNKAKQLTEQFLELYDKFVEDEEE